MAQCDSPPVYIDLGRFYLVRIIEYNKLYLFTATKLAMSSVMKIEIAHIGSWRALREYKYCEAKASLIY
jgi:hypothetical protein